MKLVAGLALVFFPASGVELGSPPGAFDPPSETLSPKHDKKRPKDVASKKSKKKKKKKSEKTSTTLRQSQVQAVPAHQDFDDPVVDLLCHQNKEENPADQTHPTGYKSRGVAKMMVRSGRRCPCHYVRRHLCPVKLLADEFGFTSSTSASL